MVTMQQIADRCGVSRGTVDRALHHKEGVREEVAERIRATAREMGYISNRLVMQQTRQWKIGVVLHSGHSAFVQMLYELFSSFSERELIPNITVIVRVMQDMDVQHQLTLIDELVTTEHIDGLALMPLANTLVRDRINTLSEQQGIPVVTFNTDITDANRLAYVGADNIAAGRAAAALLGMVMQGRGSVLPILGQRSGHYADSQRYTGFLNEMAENFPGIRILHPECSFLDENLAERIASRAIHSDEEVNGFYLTSAGREGVYRAVNAAENREKIHIVVHDITEGNVRMVKQGTVDFIIGQDVKTQGTLPIRLLYDYLERHQFPKERMNITDITIKFRCNV
nr:LacI family DNA-binding transcriptional regulator [uncultured Agathobaculum sp.]